MRSGFTALLALSLFASVSQAQQPAWADKIFGANTVHDFGVVARGAQVKHSFKMTNIYKVPLDITDIKVQCGCVTTDAAKKTLQPNESALFHVHMDAKQFAGPKTVRIYVTVGPKYVSTATLTVSADARGDVAFTPREVDFGLVQRGQTPTKSIDVEYSGSQADWRVVEILKSGAAPFDLKVEDLPRQPGGVAKRGYRISATIKPNAASGAFKQEITLKTNDTTNPTMAFQIVGNLQAGISVTPNPVAVRDMKVGDTFTKKVFLRASRPFKITSVDGQEDGISVEFPSGEDAMQIITVQIAPTKAGELRRQLTIRTDLDNETATLDVQVTVEP